MPDEIKWPLKKVREAECKPLRAGHCYSPLLEYELELGGPETAEVIISSQVSIQETDWM